MFTPAVGYALIMTDFVIYYLRGQPTSILHFCALFSRAPLTAGWLVVFVCLALLFCSCRCETSKTTPTGIERAVFEDCLELTGSYTGQTCMEFDAFRARGRVVVACTTTVAKSDVGQVLLVI